MKPRCEHVVLAEGSGMTVDFCRHCHAVAIHTPAITLRLTPEGAEAAWAVLGDALHALKGELEEESRGLGTPVGHA